MSISNMFASFTLDDDITRGIDVTLFDSIAADDECVRILAADRVDVLIPETAYRPLTFLKGTDNPAAVKTDGCLLAVNTTKWGLASESSGADLLDIGANGYILLYLSKGLRGVLARHGTNTLLDVDDKGCPRVKRNNRGLTMLAALGVRLDQEPPKASAKQGRGSRKETRRKSPR